MRANHEPICTRPLLGKCAKNGALVCALLAQIFASNAESAANFPFTDLTPYYQHAVIAYNQTYYEQNRARFPYLFPREFETKVWFTGAANLPDTNVFLGLLPGVFRFVSFGYAPDRPQDGFRFFGYRDAVCGSTGANLPSVPTTGLQVNTSQIWSKYPGQTVSDEYANCSVFGGQMGRTELQVRET